jgi:hypothetical protein
MIKVVLYKGRNNRTGEVNLRFRVQDGKELDMLFDTGEKVQAFDLMPFAPDGSLQPCVTSFKEALQQEIIHYRELLSVACLNIRQRGEAITLTRLKVEFEDLLRKENPEPQSVEDMTLVPRFRLYSNEEHDCGRISDRRYADARALAGKLERYLVIRERSDVLPREFTTEMLVDFEKFCIDEYLYAEDPMYASLYPRDFARNSEWPKHRLQELSLQKVLLCFQAFWQDLVSFGEIEKSPYADYVSWMEPKKFKKYSEIHGDPLTLTMDEFQKVLNTPVPESLAPTRYAFILHCCLGCRGEDFKKLGFSNIAVSKEGIPYIYYTHVDNRHKGYESSIRVPIVRIAFDTLMRTQFDYFFGCYNAPYNKMIQKLLRFCGITRTVCLYNSRTGVTEEVPLCDAFCQSQIHLTHMDILHELETIRGIRGNCHTGPRTLEQMKELPLEEHFRRLNQAFCQKPFHVDENLNIIDGAPFQPHDPMVYREMPEKGYKGKTIPYIIEKISVLSAEEEAPADCIEINYHPDLSAERPLFVCGDQFESYLGGVDHRLRIKVLYGLLLLRRLGSFDVPFIKQVKGSLYMLRTQLFGCTEAIYFYVNADSIVVLHGRRLKRSGQKANPLPLEDLEQLRWEHVIGKCVAKDYSTVVDGALGALGTQERESSWARACSCYVNQVLIETKEELGLDKDAEPMKDEKGVIGHIGHRERTLPLDYLRRILKVFNCKAVVTRPLLETEWRPAK